MNRNQKIAAGCGGAGCLGLIILAVIAVFGYLTYVRTSNSNFANRGRNSNFNYNVNLNSNSNTEVNADSNTNDKGNDSSSSLTSDEKHRLFQAAGITKDSELIMRVLKKIGFPTGTGSDYAEFVKEHFTWATTNFEFIQSVNTREKGRAYVEAHLDD
jgi:hypothetical protein